MPYAPDEDEGPTGLQQITPAQQRSKPEPTPEAKPTRAPAPTAAPAQPRQRRPKPATLLDLPATPDSLEIDVDTSEPPPSAALAEPLTPFAARPAAPSPAAPPRSQPARAPAEAPRPQPSPARAPAEAPRPQASPARAPAPQPAEAQRPQPSPARAPAPQPAEAPRPQPSPSPAPRPHPAPTTPASSGFSGPPVPGDEALKARLFAGARVGRYTVVRHLDQGGMGLIFAARDEELDRPVALKILRAKHLSDEASRARLVREAQSLAKLSHPNVVAVFEVGEFEGHVFVAMELVEGLTLRAWAQQGRGWHEIVAMYSQAGRGLAAAHAAGIIHRDFKPGNALVGHDGRVRVVDFGLARAPEVAGNAITVAGAIAGTPAYMAPEQLSSGDLDPRTDQYAFCVTLAEALYGERPFPGKTVEERRRELLARPHPDLPRSKAVPPFLRAALLRGLSPDPADRFPTMAALLAAIDRNPARQRRRILLAVAVAALLLLLGFLIARRGLAACDDFGAELAGVWDDARREAVRAAVLATGVTYAESTWERLGPALDGYAGAWKEGREGACAAHQRGEHSAELYGLQVSCLQRRRSALASLVDSLAAADPPAARAAIEAVGALPPLATCGDIAALTAAVPPADPAVAAEVQSLRERLAAAPVADSLGRQPEALAIAEPLLARAVELGYVPLEAEALGVVGELQSQGGDFEAAERTLTRAVWLSDQVRDDDLLARNMADLIVLVGDHRRLTAEALRWRDHADTVIARLPDGSLGEARLIEAIATVLYRTAQNDAAVAHFERALAIREALHGPSDLRLLHALTGLGNAHLARGEIDRARAHLERARTIQEAAFGPDHPGLARVLSNLALLASKAGDLDTAIAESKRALELAERALPPDHPDLARAIGNLGAMYGSKGDIESARPYVERAFAIEEKTLGPDNPRLIYTLFNLASIANELGDQAATRARFDRALQIGEKSLPPGDPQIAQALASLATLDLREGNPRAAIPRLERALTIREAHPDAVPPRLLATTRRDLAAALRAADQSPARQRELATAALTTLREVDPEGAKDTIAELESWLAEGTDKKSKKKKKKKAKKKAKKKTKKK